MNRCKWCNLENSRYVDYHDSEWGILNLDENYLFEMLVLESFQAGLSWECILNKRRAFAQAFDNFDTDKIINYDENKVNNLLLNKGIIRNKNKILASINNSRIFKSIVNEYGSFYKYLCIFTKDKIYYENNLVTSPLSDAISKDLQKRGMKFVGSTIIYSFLQAVGIIYSHEKECFLYKSNV